ncbi:MAG: hypothetical protein KF904_22175 [Rhodoblastus sp.]|nr:hypothetical protein [Rhodoblastus sp.]
MVSIHAAHPVVGLARFVVVEPRQSVREEARTVWSIEGGDGAVESVVTAAFERSGFRLTLRLLRSAGEQPAPASHLIKIVAEPIAPRHVALLDIGTPCTWERGVRQDLRAWRAPDGGGGVKLGLLPSFELLHRDCLRHCDFLGMPVRAPDGRTGVITFVMNAPARECLRVAMEAVPVRLAEATAQ